mmetsp:Transcript_9388/g.17675  ORF Transcript_9388/g.17675 Transcript_9388/m.17675 type:complete len:116 (-) Transcript_9388:288-635(-)
MQGMVEKKQEKQTKPLSFFCRNRGSSFLSSIHPSKQTNKQTNTHRRTGEVIWFVILILTDRGGGRMRFITNHTREGSPPLLCIIEYVSSRERNNCSMSINDHKITFRVLDNMNHS